MIGSAAFSPHPVCGSVADMPLCVLIKRAGVSARLGVVCETGEGSSEYGHPGLLFGAEVEEQAWELKWNTLLI